MAPDSGVPVWCHVTPWEGFIVEREERADIEEAIGRAWRRQIQAMDAGDAQALRGCFTPDMHLTHMTGYVQPLDEWLHGVRTGQFVYHRIEEHSVAIMIESVRSAYLVAHVTTGITDDASGHAWDLRMEQDYRRDDDGTWRCAASRVSLGQATA